MKASYTFYLKGTGIPGSRDEVMCTTDECTYTFETICGPPTFYLSSAIIDNNSYQIDNGLPYLEVPVYHSYSPDCSVGKYELYDSATAPGPSTNFNQESAEIRGNYVRFDLAESLKVERADYSYTLLGSEITGRTTDTTMPHTEQYTFRLVCGESTFTARTQDSLVKWVINNEVPTLDIPQFASYSTGCTIGTYELYEDERHVSTAFVMDGYETLEETNAIRFTMLEDLKNVKDTY